MIDLLRTFRADPDAHLERRGRKQSPVLSAPAPKPEPTRYAKPNPRKGKPHRRYELTDGTKATLSGLEADPRNVHDLDRRQIFGRLQYKGNRDPDRLFRPIGAR